MNCFAVAVGLFVAVVVDFDDDAESGGPDADTPS